MDLHAHYVHAAKHDRWPELVLAEDPDSGGLEIYGSDDSYTITISAGEGLTCTGGIKAWYVESGELTLELEPAAAASLSLPERLSIRFDSIHDESVGEVLGQLLGTASDDPAVS